jgi:fumarylacetoacetate (FAA) hydrolase
MKLASLRDGSRDGQLAVVSRDLASAVFVDGITRLQQALDDWAFAAPQLQDLSDALNGGRARHAFAFDPAQCAAPLPRPYGWWVDGGGVAAALHGAHAPLVAGGERLDVEPMLVALTDDVARGADAAEGLRQLRLLMLVAQPWRDGRPCGERAAAPVAVTPDEFGAAATTELGGSVDVARGGIALGRFEARARLGDAIACHAAGAALGAGSAVAVALVPGGCIAARRGDGATPVWLGDGDVLRVELRVGGRDGRVGGVFGAIERQVVRG